MLAQDGRLVIDMPGVLDEEPEDGSPREACYIPKKPDFEKMRSKAQPVTVTDTAADEIAEKDRKTSELKLKIKIQAEKIEKLEKLVKLKDKKIETLSGRLQQHGLGKSIS